MIPAGIAAAILGRAGRIAQRPCAVPGSGGGASRRGKTLGRDWLVDPAELGWPMGQRAAGRGAEQRRGCHGGEEGAARWGQPISERGDVHADRAGRWGEGVRSDGPNGEKGSSWAALGHAGGKGAGDGLGRTEPGLGRFGLMGLGFILFCFLFPISNTTQSKTI